MFFFLTHICAFYFNTAAVSYAVEVDRAHRRGLTSRAMFLNDSSSELEYQFNGTLKLKEQNHQKCIKLIARLKVNQVSHSYITEKKLGASLSFKLEK